MNNKLVKRGNELYDLLHKIDNFLEEVEQKDDFQHWSWRLLCYRLGFKKSCTAMALADIVDTGKPEQKFVGAVVELVKDFRVDVVNELKNITAEI